MSKFNLSKINKIAFYDDGKGLIQKQTRAMMNCWKLKMESGKMGAQEAYMSCVEEYQKSDNNNWAIKYAGSSNINTNITKKAILDQFNDKNEENFQTKDRKEQKTQHLQPKAMLIKTDGSVLPIKPKNGEDFKLEELSKYVGGYIEIISLSNNKLMILNEEGKIIGLNLNEKATRILNENSKSYLTNDIVVGNVIICDDDMVV